MDRVFLEANVLYSPAYLERSGLARLSMLDDVQLLTSVYGLEEARRNLARERPEAVARLERLCKAISTVNPPQGLKLPANAQLDDKDQPILVAAIHSRAHYLLTGDARPFAHLYGKRIATVLVLKPAQYLTRRRRPRWTGRSAGNTGQRGKVNNLGNDPASLSIVAPLCLGIDRLPPGHEDHSALSSSARRAGSRSRRV